jgi:NAD(P)-dependent dehydrogenase (short-subunit alcohol dehydrogenase family)
VTGLVANAGIVAEKRRLDEVDADRVRRLLEVNVVAPILCCREAVRRMSTRHGGQGGSIVLVSSVASRLGSPGEYVDYAASKAAVDTLGLGLAQEVAAEGIRVNVVRPGIIDTGLHASGGQPDRAHRLGPSLPLGRPGTADEVAAAVVWLLSAEASYCTGSMLDVAGGR